MPLEVGNMGGIGDFVAALTGRDKIRKQAEDDAWARAVNIGRAKKAAAEAGITEDKLTQRGGLAEAIFNAAPPGTMTREQAAGLATIGRGGFGNFPQLVQGQSGLFDLGQTQRAAQMATQENPDTAMLNRVLAARVSGGGPLSPQETDPEGLASALIGTEQAQAGSYRANAAQNYASANAANELAGLRARTDPNIRSTGGGSAAAGGGSLSPDTMAMFSRPNPLDPTGKPVLDPSQYQDFLGWWQSTGGTGNINDAARRWLTIRNPVFIDPTNPSSMSRSPSAGLPQAVPDTSQLEADLRRDGAPTEAISEIVRSITQGRSFDVQVPAQQQRQRFTAEDAQQALADAREAIRRGLISPEEAKRRLREAGMSKTAEFIR